MITSTEELWFVSGVRLSRQLQNTGMEVLKPPAFEPGLFKYAILDDIKRSGLRFVILMAYDEDVQSVASMSALGGLTSRGWAWALMEGLGARAMEHTQGWLYIQPVLYSGSMQAFAKQVSDHSKSRFNISTPADSVDLTYSVALYDAIVLYAHAATKVMSEGGDLRDGYAVTAAVRDTTFQGVGNT